MIVNLSQHQDDLMMQDSVMTTFCVEEEKIAELVAQCSFEVNESAGAPVAMTEQQEEDEDILSAGFISDWFNYSLYKFISCLMLFLMKCL